MENLKLYDGNRVTLMACSSCNAKCNDCYIGYSGNRDPQELYNIAYSLMQDGKHVRIDGAEVLTNLDYLKTLKLVGQNWIMTNGLRIYKEPKIINLLKDSEIDTVYMSYHFEIQNVIDSIPSQIVDQVIKLLTDNDFNIYLNCTLTNKNCDGIIQYAEYAYRMGAKGIGFNKIFQQGKAKDISNLDLTYEQLAKFFRDLSFLRNKYDKNEFYITRGGSLGHDFVTGKDNFRCNAGYNRVMITPDNNVYCCNAMCTPGYEIGKLINGKIYINKAFFHNQNLCLAEILGLLNEKSMSEINYSNYHNIIKKYEKVKVKN